MMKRRAPLPAERVFHHLDGYPAEDRCWNWNRKLRPNAYPTMALDGKVVSVPRLVHELLVGPIPAGLFLSRLCGDRSCCNPKHSAVATSREALTGRKALPRERVFDNLDNYPADGCWLRKGRLSNDGYAGLTVTGRRQTAWPTRYWSNRFPTTWSWSMNAADVDASTPHIGGRCGDATGRQKLRSEPNAHCNHLTATPEMAAGSGLVV